MIKLKIYLRLTLLTHKHIKEIISLKKQTNSSAADKQPCFS